MDLEQTIEQLTAKDLNAILKDKSINTEKILPQTFMVAVNYQLVIRAFGEEWTACYESGQYDRFGAVTAHGNNIEEALKELLYYFLNHDAFRDLRHLLNTPDRHQSSKTQSI